MSASCAGTVNFKTSWNSTISVACIALLPSSVICTMSDWAWLAKPARLAKCVLSAILRLARSGLLRPNGLRDARQQGAMY